MSSDVLLQSAKALGLHGVVAQWSELAERPWIRELLDCEEAERRRRSLERRVRNAKIGRFKPMTDFNWSWPKAIDRPCLSMTALLRLSYSSTRGTPPKASKVER